MRATTSLGFRSDTKHRYRHVREVPSSGAPLQFAVGGRIISADPIRRSLQIGTRDFWVDLGVSMGGLAPGKTVTAGGYQEHGTGRWIVTWFTHS
jgi:hypothetical protein